MASARTYSQIIRELNPTYNPQVASLRKQQAMVPASVEADIAEAEGAQRRAFDTIMQGARQRGLGFAGIPLGEQARYSTDVFAPSVLRARTQGQERSLSLEDAILGVLERRNTLAQQLRGGDLDRAFQQQQLREQQRQFNLSLEEQRRARAAAAAQASQSNAYLNDLFGQQSQATKQASAQKKKAAANELRTADAQYLGRLMESFKFDPAGRTMLLNRLRNGNADAQRRYKLAVTLGYTNPAAFDPQGSVGGWNTNLGQLRF